MLEDLPVMKAPGPVVSTVKIEHLQKLGRADPLRTRCLENCYHSRLFIESPKYLRLAMGQSSRLVLSMGNKVALRATLGCSSCSFWFPLLSCSLRFMPIPALTPVLSWELTAASDWQALYLLCFVDDEARASSKCSLSQTY